MNKRILIIPVIVLCLLAGCQSPGQDYKYVSTDVSDLLSNADTLYENGDYAESLEIYLEAMSKEPKDADARIGGVKCQIALENYEMALTNLSILCDIAPERDEVYDFYMDISKATNTLYYANYAIELARKNKQESFLSKIPAQPEINYEDGNYSEKIQIEMLAADADTKIYYSVSNNQINLNQNEYVYSQPITLLNGDTQITAYCLKDGIPGESVTLDYHCEYAPVEIDFQDPIMEQLVRIVINKPEGPITDVDCMSITNLRTYDLYTDGVDYNEYQEMKLHSLADLVWMPYLDDISLEYQTEIADYDQLANCSRLDNLSIRDGNLEDISFLAQLPSLSYVSLTQNNISDITPLLKCESLYSVQLSQNPVKNLEALVVLPQISSLDFDAAALSDYSIFEQWKMLYRISIHGLEGIDFYKLSKLEKLESLSISYDYSVDSYRTEELKDLSFLEGLHNLTYLSLDGVSDSAQLKYMEKLTNLQNLYLYSCDATEDAGAVEALRTALPNCEIHF